ARWEVDDCEAGASQRISATLSPGQAGPSSFLCHGASPWWLPVPITSPRLPTYETRGGHGSKALWVVGRPARGLRLSSCDERDDRLRCKPMWLFVSVAFVVVLVLVVSEALLQAYRRRKWAKAPQRDVSSLAGGGEAAFKHEV